MALTDAPLQQLRPLRPLRPPPPLPPLLLPLLSPSLPQTISTRRCRCRNRRLPPPLLPPPLSTTIYDCLLLLSTIYYLRLLLSTTIYYYLLLFASIYYYLLLSTTIYYHLLLSAAASACRHTPLQLRERSGTPARNCPPWHRRRASRRTPCRRTTGRPNAAPNSARCAAAAGQSARQGRVPGKSVHTHTTMRGESNKNAMLQHLAMCLQLAVSLQCPVVPHQAESIPN